MRATYWICLGLSAGLSFGLAGCKDLDQCEDPGVAEVCMCGDDPGARVCQPEYVWSDCDCGATVPDSGVTGGAGGMTGGAGGMTGGAGGMTGGAGGMTGGMGGMTGGAGGMTGGAGGMTGGAGGMTGGTGGDTPDGGDDSGDPLPTNRYAGCTPATAATDCGAGTECRESDLQLTGSPLYICAPSCAETNDCPAAPAGGTAMLECTGGHCLLPCDGFTECPTGLTCAAKDIATFTCYDDGM
jgi:hypothetical protein